MVFITCDDKQGGNGEGLKDCFECDYNVNCIQLYKRLEEEDYDAVNDFLSRGLWPGAYFKDSIAPQDQARTWVTAFDQNDKDKVVFSQLPLHVAIVRGAPVEIIAQLVELYPISTRCTDEQYMLPLHLAMRHGLPDRTIEIILRSFPDAVNAVGKADRTPIDCAKRGPKKLRAAILEAFVKGTNKKTQKAMTATYSLEISTLRHAFEEERTKTRMLEAQIMALHDKNGQDKDRVEVYAQQKMEQLVADYEKRISELQLSKKQVELDLARKVDEMRSERQAEAYRHGLQNIDSLDGPATLGERRSENPNVKGNVHLKRGDSGKKKGLLGRIGRRSSLQGARQNEPPEEVHAIVKSTHPRKVYNHGTPGL